MVIQVTQPEPIEQGWCYAKITEEEGLSVLVTHHKGGVAWRPLLIDPEDSPSNWWEDEFLRTFDFRKGNTKRFEIWKCDCVSHIPKLFATMIDSFERG